MRLPYLRRLPSGLTRLVVGPLELSVSAVRGSRAKPFHYEFHDYGGNGFVNFGWASRTAHRWWALTVWLYWTRRA